MDEATITELLKQTQSTDGGSTSLLNLDSLMQALAPFMLTLTIVSILITVLYVISVISKWRANKAIVDIRKLLIEMNEREKLHVSPSPSAAPVPQVQTLDSSEKS